MSQIKAGIVLVQKFVVNTDSVFSDYIKYMDREEAVRNTCYNEYSSFNDYMGDPSKTYGIFTEDLDSLSENEKISIKDQFKEAQKNESLMWQTVISFDNKWLEEMNIYDSKDEILNEDALRRATRKSMQEMLKKEGMEESSLWTAAIHKNTDNFHVHIAIVEPIPTREKISYKGQLQYRGKFKQGSLNSAKSKMVNDFITDKEQNKNITEIKRSLIIDNTNNKSLARDKDFQEEFFRIYNSMPGDRFLWKYNNNIMKNQRTEIDKLSKKYIEKYYMKEFKELNKMLDVQSDMYRKAYGIPKNNSLSNYKENQMKTLYSKMGNSIIKEMHKYDKKMRADKIRAINKGLSPTVPKKSPRNIQNSLKALEGAFNKDIQKHLDQKEYKNQQQEIERNNSKEERE